MAIVADKSGANGAPYGSFCTHNRAILDAARGALVPLYVGEIIIVTDTNIRWKAWGLGAGNWLQTVAPIPIS